jgi:signal transduction histidine kinase
MIQAICAVTLELESAAEDVAEDVEEDPSAAREHVDGVIDRLSEVIKDMRRYILGVQPADATAHTLPEALAALLAETRAHMPCWRRSCLCTAQGHTTCCGSRARPWPTWSGMRTPGVSGLHWT